MKIMLKIVSLIVGIITVITATFPYTIGHRLPKSNYNYVVVIGVDGMGAFCKNADTPNMDKIFENGCQTFEAVSMSPTISAQNWGSMLTGANPKVHKLTNENISEKTYSNVFLPTLFKRVRLAYPNAPIGAFCNWNPIYDGILEANLNVTTQTDSNDKDLSEKIIQYIKEKPKFLFIQFDDVDHAGHTYSYGSEQHLAQISKEDQIIKEIYDSYVEQGIIDETLFIVTADHGGNGTDHGFDSENEKMVYFGAVGKTVIQNSKPEYMQTKDISAIVLYALGIKIPHYYQKGFSSQVPEGIFNNYSKKYIK